MESAPALAWLDLHAARFALLVLRSADWALLLRKRQPVAREAKGSQLEGASPALFACERTKTAIAERQKFSALLKILRAGLTW